jgi:hypothetical protein
MSLFTLPNSCVALLLQAMATIIHNSSANAQWANSLRDVPKAPPSRGGSTDKPWVGAVSKPEITPFRHSKRLSISETNNGGSNTPKSTVIHDSPVHRGRIHKDELRPVDWVGSDEKFVWERTLRSSTQPPKVVRSKNNSTDERPWRSASRPGSAPVSASHTREHSLAQSRKGSVLPTDLETAQEADEMVPGSATHSRRGSAVHSRRGSVAHSRKASMAAHSRRSTRASIKFEDEMLAEALAEDAIEETPEPETVEEVAAVETREVEIATPEPMPEMTVRTQTQEEGPQAVKDTLAGAMLVEQAELIASMTVKQVIEQLATGTTVFKAWVRGTKQRGSTRHVKARVANDLVLLQYPSGFSKRQMTVIVSSIYVTVEPGKTVLTLETDNGTLVIKPYTPEHATLWAFGFNALLHLADKQGLMDNNTIISQLPWHGIFQSTKEQEATTA